MVDKANYSPKTSFELLNEMVQEGELGLQGNPLEEVLPLEQEEWLPWKPEGKEDK